jgi:hypothetical protein
LLLQQERLAQLLLSEEAPAQGVPDDHLFRGLSRGIGH